MPGRYIGAQKAWLRHHVQWQEVPWLYIFWPIPIISSNLEVYDIQSLLLVSEGLECEIGWFVRNIVEFVRSG